MRAVARTVAVLAAAAGVIGSVVGLAAPAALVTLPACGLPNKTCVGDRLNGFVDAGGDGRPECSRCLQQACCDLVGFCQDDPQCRDPFLEAHDCVIDGGAAAESRCTTALQGRSRDLYGCARKDCGAACNIPFCDVASSVPLIGNAECDRCIGNACCLEVNACYENRRCKLTIECIIDECGPGLSTELTRFSSFGPEAIQGARKAACEGMPNPAGEGTCVERCLDSFAPVPGTTDDVTARCLAFGVFGCSAERNCGPRCALGGGPTDAGLLDGGADGAVQ